MKRKARTRSELVQAAHDRQLEAGWRRLGLRLHPDAAAALDILLAARPGATAVHLIGELLVREAGKGAGKRSPH